MVVSISGQIDDRLSKDLLPHKRQIRGDQGKPIHIGPVFILKKTMQKTPLDTAHPHEDNRRREGAGSLNNRGKFQLYAGGGIGPGRGYLFD